MAKFLLLMALQSAFVGSAFADFGRRQLPSTPCTVKIERKTSVAKTEYGQIPFRFIRVTIDKLGSADAGKTFDVVPNGQSVSGDELKPIEIELNGGMALNVYITVGYGQNPNFIEYGLVGGAPSNQCE